MAETFTTKSEGVIRAQEIAADGVQENEIPTLSEVMQRLFSIAGNLSPAELTTLQTIKDQITAITDASINARRDLANQIRTQIITHTIETNGAANINLLTIGARSDKIDMIKILLATTISRQLERYNLDAQKQQNIIIGITAKILSGDILSILGNGVSSLANAGVEGFARVIGPMIGLGTPQGGQTTVAQRLEQVIQSEVNPIMQLLETHKDNLSVLNGFLSNPEAISSYRPGVTNVLSITAPTKEDLTRFIQGLNTQILSLDARVGQFEETKENIMGILVQGGSVLQGLARNFLGPLLGIPIIGDIIAGFLGYTSGPEALEGFFGKELKRRTSLVNLKTEKNDIPLLREKKVDRIRSGQLTKFFETCESRQIDVSKSSFWKKLFNGVPEPIAGQPLSAEDTAIKALHDKVKTLIVADDFNTAGEPKASFFAKLNDIGTVPRPARTVVETDVAAQITATQGDVDRLRAELGAIRTTKGKLEAHKNWLGAFNPTSLNITGSDLTALHAINLEDFLKTDTDWYSVVRRAVDGIGDWFEFKDSIRIEPQMTQLRAMLTTIVRDRSVFPDENIFNGLFPGRQLRAITLADILSGDGLDKLRQAYTQRLAAVATDEGRVSGLLGPKEAELARLTGIRSTEVSRSPRLVAIRTALEGQNINIQSGQTVIINIGDGKTMEIDLVRQEVKINERTLKININGSAVANGIYSIVKNGTSFEIIFKSGVAGLAIPLDRADGGKITRSLDDFVELIHKLETEGTFEIAQPSGTLRIAAA